MAMAGKRTTAAEARRKVPVARAAAGERRLLRLAAWMMERSEPFTREDLLEAFAGDYHGKDEARFKKLGRDKEALERMGVALRTVEDDRARYLVDRTALHLANLRFEDAEAAVVWMAGRAALRAGDHPLRDELESALRKLTVGAQGLPEAVPTPEPIAPPPAGKALSERLALLAEAVQRRRRLHLVYRGGAEGTETVRDVDVYGYGLRRGEWFFVGHCHLRDEPRLFYVRRVVALENRPARADHQCAVPKDTKGGDYRVPPDFELDSWRLQQPWDYRAHQPLEASVRLTGALARGARGLLPGARLALQDDGSRLATLTVRNLDGLVRQVLAWGEGAELVSPPEGRERARAMLARLSVPREVAP
jgi:predicted DNA-binding transcriptional regulator YafY